MNSSNLASIENECHRLAQELPVEVLLGDRASHAVGAIVGRLGALLDTDQRAALAARLLDRLLGLGPLEDLLRATDVTEVMVNGPGHIWIERDGELVKTDIRLDRDTVDHLVERIVAPLGRRLDPSSPLVDGRLSDGSRVHVVAPPIALEGPYVTIRRFQVTEVELEDVTTPAVAAVLRWTVDARGNIIISGGTSSGKTTLLNSMARLIGLDQRLVTIEDAAELQLPSRHVLRLEARPSSVDGPPPVTIRELVRNALRMRPDRIIIGEVRGREALDMVQAMNTGHEGSLSTCHANGPADALRRLESMITIGQSEVPLSAARSMIQSAVDLVVHLEREADGTRRVVAVGEPVEAEPSGLRLLADRRGLHGLPNRPPRRPLQPLPPSLVEVG